MSKWTNPAFMREYQRAWYKSHKINKWRETVRRKYGLTLNQYAAMMAAGCAICGQKAVHMDHDHATRKLRGALCRRCNLGLGMFGDGLTLLKKAVIYLEPSVY